MNNKFASRKFILISTIQAILFICLWTGTLTQEAFQSLTMVIISGYLVVQSTQTVMLKDKTNDTTS